MIGLGLVLIGIPPSAEEIAARFIFLLVTIAYAGVWLALAMLFSIVFRSAATAALVTLGLWLFLTLIWPALAPAVASIVAAWSATRNRSILVGAGAAAAVAQHAVRRRSYLALLNPSTRSLGPIYLSQLQGAVLGAPLPLRESLMIAWPQMVGLVAGTILLFVIGYVVFQRQEVRA